MAETLLDQAREVLAIEAQALGTLSGSLDQNFVDAVDIISKMKSKAGNRGRLIIAGIGKSGHVARKIAATMASTWTPAYFVHPGEASHGDMGMIAEDDIVLMLSNSGENAELSDLIHYTRRYDIPLIAMTSNPESFLATHSDIVLLLPKLEEACPNNLAPTTSTTMMIALGDALAVTLLKQMGLTADQFRKFHPGGKLGQQLLTVTDLMHGVDALPLVGLDTTMDKAILEMTEKNMGAVIIVDDNKALKGIITDGDLKRHMSADLLQKSVTDIMSTSPMTVARSALAVEAMNIMTKTPGRYLTSLIVVDDQGAFCGMIRLQDCLQAGVA
ncbi:MAG: KpsF/GutQ family sugar-phosphate isomerase [Alphaproteobacteria bacterium]|jgi:arabinose-5-phosphate isomerase|nr:KpsF/GutQ family sugar-phosphate isomerase [Alphaproteobacteria bacterium]MDP7222223.1 KpsF/GutQ family sugar-phosphate isomerase [Alphaproteobacteria bacterium]